MKNFLLPLAMVILVVTQSCTKNDDDTLNSPDQQVQAITAGSWRVSLFTDSGNDETGGYNGISFSFNSDGSISAAGSATKTGTWSLLSSSNKMVIDLGPKTNDNDPWGELTDDWMIISVSSSEIKLRDDNTASDEFLTFTKQ